MTAAFIACVGENVQPVNSSGVDGGPEGPDATLDASTSSDVTQAPFRDAEADVVDGGNVVINVEQRWTPKQIDGLSIWYDGSVIDETAGIVNQWTDQSGKGNHAIQGEAARKPSVQENAINAQRAVVFNGASTSLAIPDDPTIQFGKGSFAIIMCVRHSVDASAEPPRDYAMAFSKVDPNAAFPYVGVSITANSIITNPDPTNTGFLFQLQATSRLGTTRKRLNDDKFHIVSSRRLLDTIDIRVDGRLEGEETSADIATLDVSNPGIAAHLGSNGNQQYYFLKGALAELVVVKGPLADGELEKVESYMKAKYALP